MSTEHNTINLELLEALKIAVQAMRDNDIDEMMSGEFEILTDAIDAAQQVCIEEG